MDPNREPLRKIPTVHVPHVSKDIGSVLRAKREARGHSLDAVSQHTRIPKRFLEAMEKNKLDEFPALVYLRGFLKGYCEYLELEFGPLWALVEAPPAVAETTPTPPATAAKPSAKPSVPNASAAPPSSSHAAPAHAAPAAHPTPKPHAAEGGDGSAFGAILFAIALAIGLFFLVRHDKAVVPIEPAETPNALAPLSTHVEPSLTIDFKGDAWISLKSDGALVFEGRVPAGAKQEWKAKNGFLLRTQQPQNLELFLDGKPYPLPRPGSHGDYKIE